MASRVRKKLQLNVQMYPSRCPLLLSFIHYFPKPNTLSLPSLSKSRLSNRKINKSLQHGKRSNFYHCIFPGESHCQRFSHQMMLTVHPGKKCFQFPATYGAVLLCKICSPPLHTQSVTALFVLPPRFRILRRATSSTPLLSSP